MAYDSNLIQKFVVHEGSEASDLMPMHVALVNDDGSDFGGGKAATVDTLGGATETGKSLMKASNAEAARNAIGAGTSSFSGSYDDLTGKPTIPTAATTTAAGIVKKSSAVSAVASANATAATGDAPTKAEFDAVVTLVNELKTQVNDLITKAKTAGQMA